MMKTNSKVRDLELSNLHALDRLFYKKFKIKLHTICDLPIAIEAQDEKALRIPDPLICSISVNNAQFLPLLSTKSSRNHPHLR